jgi:hypothetical protein
VHLAVKLYVLDHLSAICLERAAIIMKRNPADPGDDAIRDL